MGRGAKSFGYNQVKAQGDAHSYKLISRLFPSYGLQGHQWEVFEALEPRVLLHGLHGVDAPASNTSSQVCDPPSVGTSACECCSDLSTHAPVIKATTTTTTIPHSSDPLPIQQEHMAVMNLVTDEQVTHTALTSGRWADPTTWADGRIPIAGAHVLIASGVTVTLDHVDTIPIHTLRVDGTLRFDATTNTGLLVDTIVITPTGTLQIGTADQPVAGNVTAKITFADLGPIDRTWDPLAFSRGLVSHGTVSIYGADKTDFLELSKVPLRGNTQLSLSSVPTNWQVGDKLVLTGTNPNANEDEQLTILGISGNTVTVSPLQFDHRAPETGLSVYVANLTRNVIFESQNTSDLDHRGHVMFMHSPKVEVHNAGFYGLGRTDKSQLINDSKLDDTGHLVDGTGTNQRGRYPVHFHRTGTTNAPTHIDGSVVLDSPGWGFVNHSSNAIMQDNVAFNITGASFVTEAGDEIGAFDHNIAIRTFGSGDSLGAGAVDFRVEVLLQDFAHTGHGFWLQGPGVEVTNNVAAGHRHAAYVFWTQGIIEPGLGQKEFLASNLPDRYKPLAGDKDTVIVMNVPIFKFDNNVGFASAYGLNISRHKLTISHRFENDPTYFSTFSNSTFWNLGTYSNKYGKSYDKDGITLRYSKMITFKNVKILGDVRKPTGIAINRNRWGSDIKLENVTATGWEVGVNTPGHGKTEVVGGLFNNVKNFLFETARKPLNGNPRKLILTDVRYGTLSDTALKGRLQYQVYDDSKFRNLEEMADIPGLFTREYALLTTGPYAGKQVYSDEQQATAIPFTTENAPKGLPAVLIGKTTAQLWNLYGLSLGGTVAPKAVTTDPAIGGYIGAPGTYLPTIELLSPIEYKKLTGYTLVYLDPAGRKITEKTTIDLKPGWNVITRVIGGRNRSFFVYGGIIPRGPAGSGDEDPFGPKHLSITTERATAPKTKPAKKQVAPAPKPLKKPAPQPKKDSNQLLLNNNSKLKLSIDASLKAQLLTGKLTPVNSKA